MNRERWLTRAATAVIDLIHDESDAVVPYVRVSVGYAHDGAETPAVTYFGAADGLAQIFISPEMDNEVTILSLLAHELLHAACGAEVDHDGIYAIEAASVGFRSPFDAACPRERLLKKLQKISKKLGPYPHVPLPIWSE